MPSGLADPPPRDALLVQERVAIARSLNTKPRFVRRPAAVAEDDAFEDAREVALRREITDKEMRPYVVVETEPSDDVEAKLQSIADAQEVDLSQSSPGRYVFR